MKIIRIIKRWIRNLYHRIRAEEGLTQVPSGTPSLKLVNKHPRYGRISMGQSAKFGMRYRNTDPRKVAS